MAAGRTKMLSFSNLSDRCTQFRQIIRCLAMQALVHRHPKLVRDSICHIEPMQLRVKQVCQAVFVLLHAAHNSRCSVQDPLQLVGNRLWCITPTQPLFICAYSVADPKVVFKQDNSNCLRVSLTYETRCYLFWASDSS